MDRNPYVLRRNIENFRRLLETGTDIDAQQRETVESLLAEAEAKLAEVEKAE